MIQTSLWGRMMTAHSFKFLCPPSPPGKTSQDSKTNKFYMDNIITKTV